MAHLTYRKAGVDIGAADRFVDKIKRIAAPTRSPDLLSGIGLFAAAMRLPAGLKEPVILAATDGVGTKLAIARLLDRHDSIGIDLVAMNVNDVITAGATPLCFLDYLAVGKLSTVPATQIVQGIAEGCRIALTSLAGGETAEMPGFYSDGEYDLAGFVVGVAEEKSLLDGSRIRPGDVIVGLASTGLHSNGYSLARRALKVHSRGALLRRSNDLGESLGEALLRPTAIYVKPIIAAMKRFDLHGMAHITGGGIPGNLARILPHKCDAIIERRSLPQTPLFDLIRKQGKIAPAEMDRTFNCGIGFAVVLPRDEADALIILMRRHGVAAFVIGAIRRGSKSVRYDARAISR